MDADLRYSRNWETLSRADQETLKKAGVAVLGLGGLGGGVCEMLARVGVGRLILADGDQFDITNLNRQLLSREDNIGRSKAQAAKERLAKVNSDVDVRIHPVFAGPETIGEILSGADLVVDCLDTIDARFMAQEAAAAAGIPLVSGAIAGVTGQVTAIYPGDLGFELIYGRRSDADKKDQDMRGIETRTGNLVHCAALVASLQVSECLKILLGKGWVLRKKLLIVELWTNTFEVMELE